MSDIQISTSLLSIFLPLLLFISIKFVKHFSTPKSEKLPKSFPIFGSFFAVLKNKERISQWTTEMVNSTSNLTFILDLPLGRKGIFTANPANVQQILKSQFHNYHKGDYFTSTLRSLLGDGIFNTDGDKWKFQRQLASHEFNTKSLRKFVETIVDSELSDSLIPILQNAAESKTVLDFQDILQRFAFDNICKIVFGYDPEYMSPSLPQEKLAVAFEQAGKVSSERFNSFSPFFWKIKKTLNIGSEKQLKMAVRQVRDFVNEMIKTKKKELEGKPSIESVDLLSRLLISGQSDEDFMADIVINFLLAGRDTTSSALTWFFYLLSENLEAENEILKEIKEKSETIPAYDEVKDMVYTHASLCESMRLYPPVPMDTKEAQNNDVLPDGTVVKRGMRVTYHPYAMGRVERVWGKDWAHFRPTRWLKKVEGGKKWSFITRDPYTYPVFQAGPRICLGKDMAFLQMKAVVARVVRRFKVVPVVQEGAEPVFMMKMTAKMKGGFMVRIEERAQECNDTYY